MGVSRGSVTCPYNSRSSEKFERHRRPRPHATSRPAATKRSQMTTRVAVRGNDYAWRKESDTTTRIPDKIQEASGYEIRIQSTARATRYPSNLLIRPAKCGRELRAK
jgi:hypothetical protein